GDEEGRKAGHDQQHEHRPREPISAGLTPPALLPPAPRRDRPAGQSPPPTANRSTLSERRARRRVSSDSTSAGAMLPRLHSVPNCLSSHTCCSRRGASKIRCSG